MKAKIVNWKIKLIPESLEDRVSLRKLLVGVDILCDIHHDRMSDETEIELNGRSKD